MPNKSKIEPYDHLLGEMYDYEIAEMAGTLSAAVCKRRIKKGIDPFPIHVLKKYEHLMGKQSDLSLSETINIPCETIGAYRRSKGIERYSGPYRSRLSKIDPLIGTMSNAALARLAGCSREGVRGRRQRLADSGD
uniref:hypothetical protein n=1 Tax=Pseudomonas syringae TaxID=317 RepID=UPI001E2CC261|nr:hypothetical protein [Pseudomonas syringae]QOQ33531.1 hypothetical protein [Pseudomonas syringae pv. actinidiae]